MKLNGELNYTKVEIHPGGEIKGPWYVRNNRERGKNCFRLSISMASSDLIMHTLMVADSIRRQYENLKIDLVIPYVPYARQDEVFKPGDPLGIKVFADLINSQNFNSVHVLDPHSAVTPALINKCVVHTNQKLVERAFVKATEQHERTEGFWVVSPDSGAFKKTAKLVKSICYSKILGIANCTKVRGADGVPEGFSVSVDDFGGKDVFIVDDILDGGRTFYAIAPELKKRNARKVFLVVTHSIFSHGYEGMEQSGIDHVFTTNSFKQHSHPLVTQFTYQSVMEMPQ